MSLRDLPAIGWEEAWWLTSELLRDPWSHVSSALRGDTRVPSAVEEAILSLFEAWVNAKRGKNQTRYTAPRPWEGAPEVEKPRDDRPEKVSRAERLRMLEAI